MTTINSEPGLSNSSDNLPVVRNDIDRFNNPWPGEDGTPPVIDASSPVGMSKEVKQFINSRIERNKTVAAERGIGLDNEIDAEDPPARVVAQTPSLPDEIELVVQPVSSVQEDIGYRRVVPVANSPSRGNKKVVRKNRAGKNVQRARQNKARRAASQFVAEARAMDRTPKLGALPPEDPEF